MKSQVGKNVRTFLEKFKLHDGTIIEDSQSIANELNIFFFVNVSQNLAEQITGSRKPHYAHLKKQSD